jgi:hypothetical protein
VLLECIGPLVSWPDGEKSLLWLGGVLESDPFGACELDSPLAPLWILLADEGLPPLAVMRAFVLLAPVIGSASTTVGIRSATARD